MNEATAFCKIFHQNDCFLMNRGPLKISLDSWYWCDLYAWCDMYGIFIGIEKKSSSFKGRVLDFVCFDFFSKSDFYQNSSPYEEKSLLISPKKHSNSGKFVHPKFFRYCGVFHYFAVRYCEVLLYFFSNICSTLS